MSESNSDNKEIIEAEAVVSKSDAKVIKDEEVTKAKKTVKAKKAKKVEEVVASEVVVEEVAAAPYLKDTKNKEASKYSASTSTYLSIAAGILLVVTLTVVTFFQDEFVTTVASLIPITTADEVVSDSSVAAQDSDLASNGNAQMSDQTMQVNYGYQPVAMNNAGNMDLNEIRQNQRAAYNEAMRKHNERMAGMNELRTAEFKRIDQERIDRQKKFEVMRTKTQQIQFEMQQKMQAVYDEFHSI